MINFSVSIPSSNILPFQTLNPDIYSSVSKLATKVFLWKAWCHCQNYPSPLIQETESIPPPSPLNILSQPIIPTQQKRLLMTPKVAFQRVLDGAKIKQPSVHIHFHLGRSTLQFQGPNLTYSFCAFSHVSMRWAAAECLPNRGPVCLPEGLFQIKEILLISIQSNMCSQSIFIPIFNSAVKNLPHGGGRDHKKIVSDRCPFRCVSCGQS